MGKLSLRILLHFHKTRANAKHIRQAPRNVTLGSVALEVQSSWRDCWDLAWPGLAWLALLPSAHLVKGGTILKTMLSMYLLGGSGWAKTRDKPIGSWGRRRRQRCHSCTVETMRPMEGVKRLTRKRMMKKM